MVFTILTIQSRSQAMEVHHHKHTPGHKKKWKGFLGEFFMLFLAVFSAFVAENLREHYVEKSREKEYVQSMIDDLGRDTLQLHQASRINTKVVKGIDSLLYYIKADMNDDTRKKLYAFSPYVTGSILYENSSGTISQLKNAGGLRLIKDTASVNGIVAYDQFNELLRKDGQAYYSQTMAIIDLLGQLLDFSIAKQQLLSKQQQHSSYFVKTDPDKLRELYNKCFMQQRIISGYILYLDKQYEDAKKLIGVLRKHYHLEQNKNRQSSSAGDTLHKDSISTPQK
jgi:hypothetical protein